MISTGTADLLLIGGYDDIILFVVYVRICYPLGLICSLNIQEMPQWYLYDHDVLLMELVLRSGLDTDRLLVDLEGENRSLYETRVTEESYFEFKIWISNKWNVLHRLKYVTDTMVRSLYKVAGEINDSIDYSGYESCSVLFTKYQRQTHSRSLLQRYPTISSREWETHALESRQIKSEAQDAKQQKICCSGIFSRLSKQETKVPHVQRQRAVSRKGLNDDDKRSPLMSSNYAQLPLEEEEEEESLDGLAAGAPHKGTKLPKMNLSLGFTEASWRLISNKKFKRRKPGKIKKASIPYLALTGEQSIIVGAPPRRQQHLRLDINGFTGSNEPFVERLVEKELTVCVLFHLFSNSAY